MNKSLGFYNRKGLWVSVYNMKSGGSCERGERADLTGCTPANGEGKLTERQKKDKDRQDRIETNRKIAKGEVPQHIFDRAVEIGLKAKKAGKFDQWLSANTEENGLPEKVMEKIKDRVNSLFDSEQIKDSPIENTLEREVGEIQIRKEGEGYPYLCSIFGKELSGKDVALLVGVQGNAKIDVYNTEGKALVEIQGDGYKMKRSFQKTSSGEISCINEEIEVKDQGKGLGAKIFSDQVEHLSKIGIKEIKCHAAGHNGDYKYVGYKVWPKVGYDGPLKEGHKTDLVKAGKQYSQVDTIQELYALPGGREAWEKYGYSIDLSFDLKPNSKSLKIFNDYLAAKKAKSGQKHFSYYLTKSIDNKRTKGVEEPDLSPEDEKALDKIWNKRKDPITKQELSDIRKKYKKSLKRNQ